MKRILSWIFVAGIAWGLSGCDPSTPTGTPHQHPGQETPAPAPQKAQRYYCPMHPSYISDKPGSCPICGMDLVPLEESTSSGPAVEGRVSFTVPPERTQLSGVRVGTVERRKMSRTIRAAGRLQYNERLLSTVTLKFSGWIERLFVSADGDCVPAGAPLFEIYSPELIEAQRNHRIAREARDRLGVDAATDSISFADRALQSARDRLLLWDMTEEQIQALGTAPEPWLRTPILSKIEGTVIRRNIVQGSYVPAGTNLYEIVDHTTLWVVAEVYEYELPEISLGQVAEIRLNSRPGPPLVGKVLYVSPHLDEKTRTAAVRFEVPNADGALKPGMFGTVTIQVDLGEPLVVEDTAILDTGTRQLVFVSPEEGKFEPRAVVVGVRSDGYAVIREGLMEGEKVVTGANFLVDSESRLRAAFQGAAGGGDSKK